MRSCEIISCEDVLGCCQSWVSFHRPPGDFISGLTGTRPTAVGAPVGGAPDQSGLSVIAQRILARQVAGSESGWPLGWFTGRRNFTAHLARRCAILSDGARRCRAPYLARALTLRGVPPVGVRAGGDGRGCITHCSEEEILSAVALARPMDPESQRTIITRLLEAGVHFGHQKKRWNPKMRPFIFSERNGIH